VQFGTLRVYVIHEEFSALNFTSVKVAKLSSQTLRKSSSFRTLRRTPREYIITIALRKRTLSPVRLALKVTFSVAICHSGVSLYFWGVLTRLD